MSVSARIVKLPEDFGELFDVLNDKPKLIIIGAETNEKHIAEFALSQPDFQVLTVSNQSVGYRLDTVDIETSAVTLSFDFNDREVWGLLAANLDSKCGGAFFDSATVDVIRSSAWSHIIRESIYRMLYYNAQFCFPILSYRGSWMLARDSVLEEYFPILDPNYTLTKSATVPEGYKTSVVATRQHKLQCRIEAIKVPALLTDLVRAAADFNTYNYFLPLFGEARIKVSDYPLKTNQTISVYICATKIKDRD